jgi:nitroimidazol reductase NimA-like FMN-containing flavoprotein (pyridoxamine 5'-phosphate oxidase superfamily)
MEFRNANVRRQDRLLDEKAARRLLEIGEYGFLSLIYKDEPYGIPISYVWDGEGAIYLHCAPEGKKLNCIAENANASFSVVGRTNVISDKFTTEFGSIILKCSAITGLAAEERMKALELILDKYSPEDKERGLQYAEKSFHRTEIIRLDIKEFSGKSKALSNK